MAPVLYFAPQSTPCQLVLLVAKHLNLKLELRELHPWNKEEVTPEFRKVNPICTIPTLDDNNFYLSESRAISLYLLEQYGNDDSLFPKDPETKALVYHRLFFDLGVLWQRTLDISRPLIFTGKLPSKEKIKCLEEGLEFLDGFLDGHKWLVKDHITVADYSTLAVVSFIQILPEVQLNKYKNVSEWFEMAKRSIEGYDEIIAPQVEEHRKFFLNKLKSSK